MLLTFRLYNLVYKNLQPELWHGVPHFSLCDVLLILRLVTGFSLLISPLLLQLIHLHSLNHSSEQA